MAGKRKLSADVWFREFILLWLIVAAVSLLAYFAHVRNSGEVQGIEYTADFDTVGSLEKGDKVYSRGLEIGYVNHLEVSPEDISKIRVTMTLDDVYHIREDYIIEIRSFDALGGSTVHLHLGNPTKELISPSTVLKAGPPIDFEQTASEIKNKVMAIADDLSNFSEAVTDETNSLQLLTNKESGIFKDAQDSMTELEASGDKLKAVIEDFTTIKTDAQNSFENMKTLETEFNDMQASIDNTQENVQDLFGEFNDGKGDLAKLMNNGDLIKKEMDIAEENFISFGKAFENKESSLYLMFNDDSIKQNFERGQAEFDEINKHFEDIQNKYTSAQGSLGLWVKDPAFYGNVRRTFDNIDDATNEIIRKGPYNSFGTYLFDSLGN